MLSDRSFAALDLNEGEQIVFACNGRNLPSLSSVIWVLIFAPALFFIPLLVIHHIFRPVCYIITTQRVLVIEPEGVLQSISLSKITKIRGTRSSLMIYARDQKMWLSRLQDAWHFETIINNVIEGIKPPPRE